MRTAHIILRGSTCYFRSSPFRGLPLTTFQSMSVEPFPVRDLAADYLILIFFQTITITLVSSLRCGNKALKIFQQLKEIHYAVSKHSGLQHYVIVPDTLKLLDQFATLNKILCSVWIICI